MALTWSGLDSELRLAALDMFGIDPAGLDVVVILVEHGGRGRQIDAEAGSARLCAGDHSATGNVLP